MLRGSHLSKRGWILQERLLSCGVLHYHSDEISWECWTCLRRETDARSFAGGGLEGGGLTHLDYGRDFRRRLFHHDIRLLASVEIFRKWHSAVHFYSGLDLTKESDRLPALSGIASEFANTRGLSYMGGLWQEDPLALLWTTEEDREKTNQISTEDARNTPTWSWASVNRAASWEWIEDHSKPNVGAQEAQIEHTDIRPVSLPNPLGEIRAGSSITLLASVNVKSITHRFVPGPRLNRDLFVDVDDGDLRISGSGSIDARDGHRELTQRPKAWNTPD